MYSGILFEAAFSARHASARSRLEDEGDEVLPLARVLLAEAGAIPRRGRDGAPREHAREPGVLYTPV